MITGKLTIPIIVAPVVISPELANENPNLVIYPNPTDGFVNIRTLDKEIIKIVVTDIIGNLVFRK